LTIASSRALGLIVLGPGLIASWTRSAPRPKRAMTMPYAVDRVAQGIDQGGNEFWGVQLTDTFVGGTRVVAYSDRDYGLYLARGTRDRS
jgi:hypothetical protein